MNIIDYGRYYRTAVVFNILFVAMLVGCSGGETGTGENGEQLVVERVGSGGQVFIGAISAFGSVFLNGIEFDTNNARFYKEGVEVNESAFTQGMVISLVGEVNRDSNNKTLSTGIAKSVSYYSLLKGPIETIVPGKIMVLGQEVLTNEHSIIDSEIPGIKNFSELQPGFLIDISGYASDSSIYATRIGVLNRGVNADAAIKVEGMVDSLNQEYFTINQLLVYVTANTEYRDNIPLFPGAEVSVGGHYANVNGEVSFYADYIKLIPQPVEGVELEIDGFIIRTLSNGVMTINSTQVRLTADSQIINGSLTDLSLLGGHIEVHGRVDINGTLLASQIEIKKPPVVEFSGYIEDVDVNAASFRVFGRTIYTNYHTIFKDEREQPNQYFRLSHLIAGDRVDSNMQYEQINNHFTATKLQRKDNSAQLAKLKGPLLAVEDRGSNIMVNIAGLELELANSDNHLFFQESPGTIVSVTGSYNSVEDVFEVNEVKFNH